MLSTHKEGFSSCGQIQVLAYEFTFNEITDSWDTLFHATKWFLQQCADDIPAVTTFPITVFFPLVTVADVFMTN